MNHLLVLGGVRSGKSRYAQTRAEALDLPCTYIATAQAFDDEMRERIAHHQADRNGRWTTVEAPFDLASAVRANARDDRVILIDCLTLWVSNLLLAERDVQQATDDLTATMALIDSTLIFVSNEVGLGIVPDNALARRFRDIAGIVNQQIAAAVDEVQFLAAGLPLRLK